MRKLNTIIPNQLRTTFLIVSYLFLFISSHAAFGQNVLLSKQVVTYSYTYEAEEINWMNLEEAMVAYEQDKKKLFFEIYTEWCNWCKQMDEVTLKNSKIAQVINDNYYPVKFDAEFKNTVKFKNKEYEFVMRPGRGGYHELAAEFLEDKLSYPTLVFMDENLNIIQAIVGFKSPEEFEKIITYFATDEYKKTPWSLYRKRYSSVQFAAPKK